MKKLLLFIMFIPFMALAKHDSTMYVAAKSGLSLREYQSTNAAILQKIAYGEKVSVIKNDSTITVEGFETVWTKVRYKDKIGYVVNIYLFELPPPNMGIQTVDAYLKQLSQLALPTIKLGGNGVEDEEEGRCYIEKNIYKNGFEHHTMLGYEYSSSMYILPNMQLNSVFQVFRGIPEFKRFLNAASPFPRQSKKMDKTHRITVSYFVDENGMENHFRLEKISFYAEDNDIAELEFFEKEGQVFVIFGAGV